MSIAKPSDADRAVLRRLGLRVKVLRTERRMSQEQLAVAAGLDRTYVSRIERGAHNVTVLTLARLAAVFDISTAALLTADGDLAHAVAALRAEVDRLTR